MEDGLTNHVLAGCVCAAYLGSTGVHYGKKASWQRQSDASGNALLGNLGSRTTIVADHVDPFMEVVFPDDCGLFQPCKKANMV